MNTVILTELETRLHRLERQNRFLILLLLGLAGIGSIAATNHAGEIRTAHLAIIDNHDKVLREEQGIHGVVYIKRYATEQTTYSSN
jgi:DMSO reductase anchor subunit